MENILPKIKNITTYHSDTNWSINCIIPYEDKIIACSDDWSIYIYSKKDLSLLYSIEAHLSEIYFITLTSDKRILTTGKEGKIKIWELKDKGLNLIGEIWKHTDAVTKVIETENTSYFISSSFDRTIKVFNSKEPYELIQSIKASKEAVNNILELSNGKLISTGTDELLKVFKYLEKEKIYQEETTINKIFCGGYNSLCEWNPKENSFENYLLVGGFESLLIIDLLSYIIKKKIILEGLGYLCSFLWLSEEDILIGGFRYFCQVNLNKDENISINKTNNLKGEENKQVHRDRIVSLYWIVDKEIFISASRDSTIKLWSININK